MVLTNLSIKLVGMCSIDRIDCLLAYILSRSQEIESRIRSRLTEKTSLFHYTIKYSLAIYQIDNWLKIKENNFVTIDWLSNYTGFIDETIKLTLTGNLNNNHQF